jgi:hypothetical protein
LAFLHPFRLKKPSKSSQKKLDILDITDKFDGLSKNED